MTAAGFTYFLTDLGWIETPATFVFADEWRGLFYAMLFWLLLAFPSGKLDSRLDRIYIVSFFVWVGIVRPFPSAAFFDPRSRARSTCPRTRSSFAPTPI